MNYQPKNPDYIPHIQDAFARQGLMQTFRAELQGISPGQVVIEQDFAEGLLQQHGGLHGGVIAALLDTACGLSAVTLLPAGQGILTIEFKTNFLSPGSAERFRFVGNVLKPGRRVTVSEGRAYAIGKTGDKLIASMTATMMTIDLKG
ncbi:MAG: PaaI family thioesterase [Rhodobacteraceae bacterium]|nr:PaaI family thioesterase [Paracoccaceae bacterium]